MNKLKIAVIICILASIILVSAADFTPQGNINLRGIYSVDNATSITATNLSGNLNWNNLTDYPVACPSGSYLTQLDDSVTCSTLSVNTTQLNSSGGSLNILESWLDAGWCKLTGCSISGDLNISGNIHVDGNFSAKRPYWNGYDNSTQNFLNTSASQIMNISNNNNYDAYLIHVIDNQNITFDLSGDYLISVSPEFYQASGVNKVITFWIQKNGVDVPWSNSRYTITNGQYFAPTIIYQVDIEII